MSGNSLSAQKVVIRIGMSKDIPVLDIGEPGWDIDYKRLRVGDGTPTPPMLMTDKSTGIFKYDFITYVEYPQINMLPYGTVDGVDISALNQTNGLITRRGDNVWAARSIVNSDGYVKITYGDGFAGNPTVDFSDAFKAEIATFLSSVAVDDVTIHGNGTTAAPLYAQTASLTVAGVSRLATGQETIDGVSQAIAVTPGGLSQRTATQARTGIVRLSTQGEVDAGQDLTTAVSPGTLRQYVANHLPTSGGYFVMNILQSQTFGTSWTSFLYNTADITYPIFLKVYPDHNLFESQNSGGSGGGAQTNIGPTNVAIRFDSVTGPDTPYLEFTVLNGVLYGVDNYGLRGLRAVGGTIQMLASGARFSADGASLVTNGTMVRYTRTPLNI